jgi:hypothetical protein
MPTEKKARAVGFNQAAIEAGDLGDRFLALLRGRSQAAADGRHFGIAADDREAVRQAPA